jgi:hypothetical protein
MIKFSKSLLSLGMLSILIVSVMAGCAADTDKAVQPPGQPAILIGWSSTDITPDRPRGRSGTG